MSARITVLVGCVWAVATFSLQLLSAGSVATGTSGAQRPKPGPPEFATLSTLPSFGFGSAAHAVNEAGTIIVGLGGVRHPVKWTLQNGSWVMTDLPLPPDAVVAADTVTGVNNLGDAAGNESVRSTNGRPVFWPATGGSTLLGCPSDSRVLQVHAISAVGQVVVGTAGGAAVWRPGGCKEILPRLAEGGAGATAVNGDGTVVGGIAGPSGRPVRWSNVGGHWSIEQLDSRRGTVGGANAAGDLVGYVYVPCGSDKECQRAVIWYAVGGFRQLDTLGGDDRYARDINATGEVVGGSTLRGVGNTAFFWSESAGMVQLPFSGRWAAARALSNVRPDGTRLVVGTNSEGQPIVWIVRNP